MTKPNLPEPGAFDDVVDWVFDLDNTLYPRHVNLFAQIDERMTAYVGELLKVDPDKARQVQKDYYRDFGTTLRGLMERHKIDANDFLEKVHDIDYSGIVPDLELGAAIKQLPGRKFIFTNGDTNHARRTAEALGILDHFDDIFDIIAADLMPKPASQTYDKFMQLHRVEADRAVMFEDLPRNLAVPKSLGMRTVLVVPANLEEPLGEVWEHEGREGEQIDYVTDDLARFLKTALQSVGA